MADILLSYERTDRQRVTPIVALLETGGWSVAWEPAGDAADAEDAQTARCIIAAWSIDSVESDAVLTVADHGLACGILVSVSIDFSRPPREFDAAPSLALAGWTGDASSPRAQELLAAVSDLLARAPQAPPAAERPVHAMTTPAAEVEAPPVQAQPPELQPEPEPDPEFELEPAREPEPELEPAGEPEPDVQWPPAFDPESEADQPTFRLEPETLAEADVDLRRTERVPALIRRDGTEEPVWAFPEEADDEARRPHLPPVLLRERGLPPLPSEEEEPPPSPPARRSLGVGLVAGCAALAIVAAAGTIWTMDWRGSPPASEVAAVGQPPDSKPVAPPTTTVQPQATKPTREVTPPDAGPQSVIAKEAKSQEAKSQEAKSRQARPPEAKLPETKPADTKPQEIEPTPAALPKEKGVEIEDLLGQVTPRVEELLTDARRLIRIGDIRGARAVLAAPETANSGSLTFLLAETYDPNVLPPALKAQLADPERARSLYRKARDLGDGRAQARLIALKTS